MRWHPQYKIERKKEKNITKEKVGMKEKLLNNVFLALKNCTERKQRR